MNSFSSSEPFPVSHSILSAEALCTLAEKAYPLEKPHSCVLLRHSWNDTYQVQTSDARYILRAYGTLHHSLSEIKFELELLNHLAQHNAPVAAPLPSKNGAFFTAVCAPEGTRYLALFPHVPGVVPSIPIGDLDQSYHFGRALATIHAAADSFRSNLTRPPHDLVVLLDQSLVRIRPFLANRLHDWQYLITVADEVRSGLNVLIQYGLDWGIIHGDPFSANACITADYHVTWYDFDFCALGWRAADLAAAYASASDHEGEHVAVWQAFLKGYRTQRQINDQDLAALPYLLAASDIWSMSTNLAKGPIQGYEGLGDPFIESRLAWVRQSVALYWKGI
jgi:Ser/Thr protein kinase RdoA (MazF antagonist)